MSSQLRCFFVFLLCLAGSSLAQAQYAVEVVSYDQGTTAAEVFNSDTMAPPEFFNVQAAALGAPERFTGEGVFPGAVTPFNAPFLTSEIVSVGEGGELTLRLSNFVLPQSGTPEIGVFTNTTLADSDFPNGKAGPAPVFAFGIDSAAVEVSEDGVNWVALGVQNFDIPMNGYNDPSQTTPTVPSDFQQPFTEPLDSFAELSLEDPNNPDILDLLAGSGGGKWLDISNSGLAQVGYIRFSVADDNDGGTALNFELDAVSIARGALGAATVPEPNTLGLIAVSLLSLFANRRR